MSPTTPQLTFSMRANTAADTNDTAVALAERFAVFVSFQRHQPSLPPPQNVDSAVAPELAAVQFSGSIAIYAINAVTTAIFTAFHASGTTSV